MRECAFVNRRGDWGGTDPRLQNLDKDQTMCFPPPRLIRQCDVINDEKGMTDIVDTIKNDAKMKDNVMKNNVT